MYDTHISETCLMIEKTILNDSLCFWNWEGISFQYVCQANLFQSCWFSQISYENRFLGAFTLNFAPFFFCFFRLIWKKEGTKWWSFFFNLKEVLLWLPEHILCFEGLSTALTLGSQNLFLVWHYPSFICTNPITAFWSFLSLLSRNIFSYNSLVLLFIFCSNVLLT